jgi:RecA/RadA recombinase
MSRIVWKSQMRGFEESLEYLDGRMQGTIKSLRTPWPKVNDATTDGLEWNSMTTIAGRPGSGKTLIKDMIVRNVFDLNPGEDFRVLEFQLEMVARVSAIREYSSILGKSYKYLCSADTKLGKLSPADYQACIDYARKRVKYPIDIVEEPPTVLEFIDIVREYMEFHSFILDRERQGKIVPCKTYKKTLITLDHSMLPKKGENEKTKTDMLYNLGEAITLLKRQYPIAFIILSQLGRGVDLPERSEQGKYGNYILESDVFGGDALVQHTDTLIGLNRPAKQKIRYYGPDRYMIADETVLVMHFLKCRNGDNRMSFFKTMFEKMQVVEMDTPPMSDKKQLMVN